MEYLWQSLSTRWSRRPGGTTKRTRRPSNLKHSIDYLDRSHGYASLKPELALADSYSDRLHSYAVLKPELALADGYSDCPHDYTVQKPELALADGYSNCPHGYVALKPELALADGYFDHIPTSTSTYTSWQQCSSRHMSNSTYTSYQRRSSRHTSNLPTPATSDARPATYIHNWSTPKYLHNHLATLHPSLPLPTNILNQLIWDLITKGLNHEFYTICKYDK